METLDQVLEYFNVSQSDIAQVSLAIEDGSYPSNYLDLLGTGAFKEAYNLKTCVIKFATQENNTISHEAALYESVPANILPFFAKSFYFELPEGVYLYSSEIESDSEDAYTYNSDEDTYTPNPDYLGDIFDCVIVQEKATLLNSVLRVSASNPLYNNGQIIPFEETMPLLTIVPYQEWLQAAIDKYGYQATKDFASFCHTNQLYDCHSRNVGFRANGEPIIFDFLS
jgi:hypothetical protein